MIRNADIPPRFRPGQLVRHVRYGYRGVVVAWDAECQAPESWYHSNRTQPLRHQPWYHVLVDGSDTTTYAAQDSLDEDLSDLPVRHPLVDTYFDGFAEGTYQRNQREWLSW